MGADLYLSHRPEALDPEADTPPPVPIGIASRSDGGVSVPHRLRLATKLMKGPSASGVFYDQFLAGSLLNLKVLGSQGTRNVRCSGRLVGSNVVGRTLWPREATEVHGHAANRGSVIHALDSTHLEVEIYSGQGAVGHGCGHIVGRLCRPAR